MAEIGLRYAKYNTINLTTHVYSLATPASLGRLVDANFTEDRASAELYADDQLAESDYSFIKGTLDLTVDNITEDTVATLFGHVHSGATTPILTKSANDNPVEVGYGQVVTKVVNGTKVYKAEYLPRIKFNSIGATHKTKGSTTEFSTQALSATVYAVDENGVNDWDEGEYYKSAEFSTLDAAKGQVDAWLTPVAASTDNG